MASRGQPHPKHRNLEWKKSNSSKEIQIFFCFSKPEDRSIDLGKKQPTVVHSLQAAVDRNIEQESEDFQPESQRFSENKE